MRHTDGWEERIMQEAVKAQTGHIISMERLHEIVNSGCLSGLCTGGVFCGAQIGTGRQEEEYTLWKLRYADGQQEHLYTLN